MNKKGKIIRVAGPLIQAVELTGVKMYEVVNVGRQGLIGEVIEIQGDVVSIQVYEETGGIAPGEPVSASGSPLTVELGPGLIQSIYDGIQRPLEKVRETTGDYILRGVRANGLSREKKWDFKPTCANGTEVGEFSELGTVKESEAVVSKIMVPPGFAGKVSGLKAGSFLVTDEICKVGDKPVQMMFKWPVRTPLPYTKKIQSSEPLVTGTRVIDSFFPIAKGGTGCIPGPFGSGKTVVLHQLAKWADADVVVYVGCGERGNEMTDVLTEFPELIDPRSGRPLLERTVLIANTSNMPVAAREASIYTGITIAEYFRNQGMDVAVMADSTSRWAEALREMSGRLEEMPGEEGYPAYLTSRIAGFYERSGVAEVANPPRRGSVSVVGAVSPPGGDLSDPVVQATLRMVKVFWSLESSLAYQRHFPAINWLNSYSLYIDEIADYYEKHNMKEFPELRKKALKILQEESDLQEIVRLVGVESISEEDRLILETAKILREDFLHQHAFDAEDSYSAVSKQFRMLGIIMLFHDRAEKAIKKGASIKQIIDIPCKEKIARMKIMKESELGEVEKILKEDFASLGGVAEGTV
ncbi:V-type ATP synthase subunit A [bacterium]|nr:V-type ATP synthase subunit A [bacterium]MBU4134325.1 V-type ATP synthase subunit A [bacterium]